MANNFSECVAKGLKAGIIDKDKADELLSGDDPLEMLSYEEAGIEQKKLQAMVDAKAFHDIKKEIYAHPKGAHVGYLSIMVRDKYGMAGNRNVDRMAKARTNRYMSKIPDLLYALRTTKFGFSSDKEAINSLCRAMFNEPIDNPLMQKEAGKLKDLLEEIRLDFNSFGGLIRDSEKYNLPQSNDAIKIRAAGEKKEEALKNWKDYITPRLDRELMTNDVGKVLDDKELDIALNHVFESILSGGVSKIKGLGDKPISMARLGKKLGNRHSEARFLHFKDADSWMQYQEKFGSGDAYGTVINHIEKMAHEIALMERFGTNPNMMHDSIQAELSLLDEKPKTRFMLDWTFNVISGKVDRSAQPAIARSFQMVRDVITASKLGSAVFSSIIADPYSVLMSAKFNKISTLDVYKNQLKVLSTPEGKKLAARVGFILDTQLNTMASINRYTDMEANVFTGKIASGVIRSSGLSALTESLQAGWGLTYAGHLADNFDKPLLSLDDTLQTQFKRYGITNDDWEKFRKTEVLNHEGATFADVTQEGGAKFHEMILSEQMIAVPSPDAFTKAISTGGLSRGTIPGEMWKMGFGLKSFPIAMVQTHLYRLMYQTQGWGKADYAAKLFIGGTIVGGLSLQLKDIALGREPRPMDNPKFWGAAMAQSGGLGIFGDLLMSDQNRFGGGLSTTVAGPGGALVDDTLKLTWGNVQEVLQGKDAGMASEMVEYTYANMPKVWWYRPFLNMTQEQLQMMVDENAHTKLKRMERKRRKDFKQEYWWKPGETSPRIMQ